MRRKATLVNLQQAPPSASDEQLAQLLHAQQLTAYRIAKQAAGAETRSFNVNQPQITTTRGKLVGFSFTETTASSTASLRLRDGDVNGRIIVPLLTLAANESQRDYPPHAIQYNDGLFVELVSGAIEGVVHIL